MKTRKSISVAAMILVVMMIGQNSYGQDFRQLLDAVDRIEANLKALLEKETAARITDISQLRKEIGKNNGKEG